MPLLPITSRPTTEYQALYHCYRIDLPGSSKDRLQKDSRESWETLRERPLLCKVCGSPITGKKDAVSKNGLHEHVFFNPSGIAFEIRCFRRAPGCRVEGIPTTEFTWFNGYSWQYGLCSTCLTHLGWRFAAAADTFFGLIGNRLME